MRHYRKHGYIRIKYALFLQEMFDSNFTDSVLPSLEGICDLCNKFRYVTIPIYLALNLQRYDNIALSSFVLFRLNGHEFAYVDLKPKMEGMGQAVNNRV